MYRSGGKPIEHILENVRETIRYRNEKKLKKPFVQLGLIVMKHNQHEIAEIDPFERTRARGGWRNLDGVRVDQFGRDADAGIVFPAQWPDLAGFQTKLAREMTFHERDGVVGGGDVLR